MGIYNSDEDVSYRSLHCNKCHHRWQIINVSGDARRIICPTCGNQVEVARALDADPCRKDL